MTTVYVAQWETTGGEYHGTVGVFTTAELAHDALRQVKPHSDHLVFPVTVDEPCEDWEG